MSKSAWLVDMGYVVKASKISGIKLDYVIARDVLSDRFGETQVFLFNSYDAAYGIPTGLKGFYNAMEQEGMVVCLHPMSGDASLKNHRQRRVDVDLACHAVWQASLRDVGSVVLTTGDQDIIPAAKLCRSRLGVRVVLFTFRNNVSHALSDAVDEHLFFEEYRDRVDR